MRKTRKQHVTFRDELEVIAQIDSIVQAQGIDRSDFLRQAIREKLARQ